MTLLAGLTHKRGGKRAQSKGLFDSPTSTFGKITLVFRRRHPSTVRELTPLRPGRSSSAPPNTFTAHFAEYLSRQPHGRHLPLTCLPNATWGNGDSWKVSKPLCEEAPIAPRSKDYPAQASATGRNDYLNVGCRLSGLNDTNAPAASTVM